MHSTKTITKVFIGCCSSAFLMEIMMSWAPNTANLITFLQFFFISLQGFVVTTKFGTETPNLDCYERPKMPKFSHSMRKKSSAREIKPNIPLKQYMMLIALFFVTSVANNYVYALHVPSTLHMIIRSASSPASMLVYCYVKKQMPKLNIAIGSILISIGVSLAMYGGAPTEESKGKFIYWCIGVIILLTTLITGAFTGLQQELLYSKYRKHPNEMLFYTHALPLPFFLGIYPQLQITALDLSTEMWLIIALNILSQFYCTHSVHELATKETSVTVTFILTVRKFISLLISSIVFKSNLTIFHVVGTVFVVVGTCIYFDFFRSRRQRPVSMKDK